MKVLSVFYFLFIFISITSAQDNEKAVNQVLNSWHNAAAIADFDVYFQHMAEESVFIGTDATERWNKKDFMKYSKPYFETGKSWNFSTLERFVNFSADGKTAWIDELLKTQMNICRGSGVLEMVNGKWLIKQYVLSMTIPNDVISKILPFKAPIENRIIDSLSNKN